MENTAAARTMKKTGVLASTMWREFIQQNPQFSVIDDVKYAHLILQCLTDAARNQVLGEFMRHELSLPDATATETAPKYHPLS